MNSQYYSLSKLPLPQKKQLCKDLLIWQREGPSSDSCSNYLPLCSQGLYLIRLRPHGAVYWRQSSPSEQIVCMPCMMRKGIRRYRKGQRLLHGRARQKNGGNFTSWVCPKGNEPADCFQLQGQGGEGWKEKVPLSCLICAWENSSVHLSPNPDTPSLPLKQSFRVSRAFPLGTCFTEHVQPGALNPPPFSRANKPFASNF